MSILSFLRKKKKPLNPEDFRLKLQPRWPDSNFVTVVYSLNAGKTWNYVYCSNTPYCGHIDYNYTWDPVVYPLGTGDFKSVKERFSTYQKILDYEKEQKEQFEAGLIEVANRRKEIKDKREAAFKRLND